MGDTVVALWNLLTQDSGEGGYPRYRARAIAQGERPLRPDEFYLQKLLRKYSQASRCC